ncbi:MAG: DNA alkylation repair protein [Bacteroidota bacterium]
MSNDNLSVETLLKELRKAARPGEVAGMARFGIVGEGRLGVRVPDIRRIAKKTGRNHRLALGLWRSGIPDARILASMVDEPEKVTERQMDAWAGDFDSWDMCDQVCMNHFDRTPHAWKKVREWSKRDEEFVRRAAFALVACLAWHDKETPDREFIRLLPLIKRGATDERNLVKKAVSWALRHIGKRNAELNRVAIETAREIRRLDSRSARWIASDAIRELESKAVKGRLKRRMR